MIEQSHNRVKNLWSIFGEMKECDFEKKFKQYNLQSNNKDQFKSADDLYEAVMEEINQKVDNIYKRLQKEEKDGLNLNQNKNRQEIQYYFTKVL